MMRKLREHIPELGKRLDSVDSGAADHGVQKRRPTPARWAPHEQKVIASNRWDFDLPFRQVIVIGYPPFFRVSYQRVPLVKCVRKGRADRTLGKDAAVCYFAVEPGANGSGEWH